METSFPIILRNVISPGFPPFPVKGNQGGQETRPYSPGFSAANRAAAVAAEVRNPVRPPKRTALKPASSSNLS
ncbi:MAG: hypothetical protein AB1461_16875 [Thermodesulfobacteriota bacterium]